MTHKTPQGAALSDADIRDIFREVSPGQFPTNVQPYWPGLKAFARAVIAADRRLTAEPALTPAQADRIIGALDPTDGGHDAIVAFVLSLATPTAPTEPT